MNTVKELIELLKNYPEDAEVNFLETAELHVGMGKNLGDKSDFIYIDHGNKEYVADHFFVSRIDTNGTKVYSMVDDPRNN